VRTCTLNHVLSLRAVSVPTWWNPDSAAFASLVFICSSVLGILILYAILSFTEYAYHRYLQHLDVGNFEMELYKKTRSALKFPTSGGNLHLAHHRETGRCMQVDLTKEFGCDAEDSFNVYRGTSMTGLSVAKLTCTVMLQAYPLLSLLGWSDFAIVTVVPAACILHGLVYNTLHPDMHGIPDVQPQHGPPSFVLEGFRDSAYFRWLRGNHRRHHLTNGACGNYAVCCPLADQLCGTYVGIESDERAPVVSPVSC